MFKKLAAAAAVSMVLVAPAMADAGLETGTSGWWPTSGTPGSVERLTYGSTVQVDWFGSDTPVTVTAASNAVGAGSYFGLLTGNAYGAYSDYFGSDVVAGGKLWLSILSGDNASGPNGTGLSTAEGGDWATVTFFGAGGVALATQPGSTTTGMACGGASNCTIENNWFYYDVPVGAVGYGVTLRQGLNPLNGSPDGINTAKLAVDYTAAAAVPEPETYAMLLAGLGAVGFMARRRSKAA